METDRGALSWWWLTSFLGQVYLAVVIPFARGKELRELDEEL